MGTGMVVNHNLSAMNANRQMAVNQNAMSKSLEKLSSGLKINRAADDASGLSISEKMRAQIRGLDQASSNAQDGISLIQTADGNLSETEDILQRVRELAVKGSTGTLAEEDSEAVQDEVKALLEEVDRIGNTTEFNTKKLLNGELKNAGGVSVDTNQTIGASIAKQTAGKLSGAIGGTVLAANFAAEELTIDGTKVNVHWENLTSEEQAVIIGGTAAGASKNAQNAAKDLIISKINQAIDDAGAPVEHISGYVDSANNLVLESGTKGIKSSITSGAAGVLNKLAGTASAGTSNYNGSTVASSSKFDLKIDDVLISQVTLSAGIGSGTTPTTMASAANILENNINGAISDYNTSIGKNQGDEGYIEKVTVNATDDGRIQINSQSGAVELEDIPGKSTVKDLGLSSAQTSSSANGGMTLQIGANKGQTMTFGIDDMRTTALGISNVDLSTQETSSTALDKLDGAIKKVSKQRSQLGAAQNRLEHTIKNLDTSSENLQSAESRIRDTDMSKEMMSYTKLNILSQAAQSMLAQANQAPQGVLQLLQ